MHPSPVRVVRGIAAAFVASMFLSGAGAAHAATPAPGVVVGPGGLCLDVAGARTADGSPVRLFECNGTAAQRWNPHPDGSLRALGKCLTVIHGYPSTIALSSCNGDRPQRWGGRNGKLRSPMQGCLTSGPAGLTLRDCGSIGGQDFSFPVAEGPISGLGGLCLDVAGANRADGTAIQVHACNGTAAQAWSRPGDGTIRALGKCLDVVGGATANGTKAQLSTCNGTNSQEWKRYANGTLLNVRSGTCLDVTDWRAQNGTRVQLWECFAGANQRWAGPVWHPGDGASGPADWYYGAARFVGTLRIDRVVVENGALVAHGAYEGTVTGRHNVQTSHGPLTSVPVLDVRGSSPGYGCTAVTLDLGPVGVSGAPGGDGTTIDRYPVTISSDPWETGGANRTCAVVRAAESGTATLEELATLLNAVI